MIVRNAIQTPSFVVISHRRHSDSLVATLHAAAGAIGIGRAIGTSSELMIDRLVKREGLIESLLLVLISLLLVIR